MNKVSSKNLLVICFLSLVFLNQAKAGECVGKFVNPITDICWNCIFPLTIGPVSVNPGGREDYEPDNSNNLVCVCNKANLPVPGIPGGFWEPARLIDVTRKPYCMVSLGGLSLSDSIRNHGSNSNKIADTKRANKKSFYHVHMYIYPLIYWLELLADFACLEASSFDVGFITELDPTWNNDELGFILNPEAAIFGNPIAQAACAADCASASIKFPNNKLFWCAGCQGSLYPFTGTVNFHVSGVQASQLLAQRLVAKMHRVGLMWKTSGSDNYTMCYKSLAPFIKKTQYKIQMTYPIPTATGDHACNPIGRSEIRQGAGKEFPYKGEDFGYLLWRKRNCCIL